VIISGVRYSTACGWVRRARAVELGVVPVLAVELGGAAVTPPSGAGWFALTAIAPRSARPPPCRGGAGWAGDGWRWG
jgi:hypothetical protein